MSPAAAALWRRIPPDVESLLRRCVQAGLQGAGRPVEVFFRADDIAVPGANYRALMRIFARRRVPLNLALVPAWVTAARWRALQAAASGGDDRLWCWHQHGWRHANHEAAGKKQEFGPSRPPGRLEDDLLRGRRRLEGILGRSFYPVFTPPWNRCSATTLDLVARLGYRGVSRSRDSRPAAPGGLQDLAVNVDLHTRRETDPAAGWTALWAELGRALSEGRCGIMIHHQRMTPAAAGILDLLLKVLRGAAGVQLVDFRQLTAQRKGK